jgi:arylsulfate sulfotransferase
MITPQGTLLIYDDGNFRASPFDSAVSDVDNYSRAVEYDINEATMAVRQVWDYGRTNNPARIFTDRVGNADWLAKSGNVLVTFGNVDYVDGIPPIHRRRAQRCFESGK